MLPAFAADIYVTLAAIFTLLRRFSLAATTLLLSH